MVCLGKTSTTRLQIARCPVEDDNALRYVCEYFGWLSHCYCVRKVNPTQPGNCYHRANGTSIPTPSRLRFMYSIMEALKVRNACRRLMHRKNPNCAKCLFVWFWHNARGKYSITDNSQLIDIRLTGGIIPSRSWSIIIYSAYQVSEFSVVIC